MTNGQRIALFAGGGVVVAGIIAALTRRYGMTSHGENQWSLEALLNVLRLRKHMEAAREAIGGKFNSVYRSEQVNNATPGSSKTSDHLVGAATDLAPGKGWTAKSAAAKIAEMAKAGKLGDVAQVIEEYKSSGASWVHVGWNHAKNNGRKLAVFTLLDSKKPPADWAPA